MIYVCVSVCVLWEYVCDLLQQQKHFYEGKSACFQAFIFPTEFTADLKKFSLEEKNRQKSYKQPHSQRDKLKLFQKYLLSRSFTLFAAFRSHFVLSSLVENPLASARERGIFRSHFSSLFSARSQRKRENDREQKISLAHTQRRFLYGTLFCSFIFCVGVSVVLFLFVLVGLKN